MAKLSTTSLARRAGAHPWKTVLIWVVILVGFGVAQAVLPLQSTPDFKLQNNPESVKGWDLLIEHDIRDERQGLETVIIQSFDKTVDDETFKSTVAQVTGILRENTKTVAGATNYHEIALNDPAAAENLVSQIDGRKTTIIPITLVGNLEQAVENAPDFLKTYDLAKIAAEKAGFTIMTVGDASINDEINTIVEEDIARGESIGAGIALIILIVVFGALVAAFVPIIMAIISIGIAFGLAALYSQAIEVSFFVTSFIPMIGLAVGIDYSLFVVERYREERRRGAVKADAIAIAGSTASRAVLFSGLTVIVALLGMFIVPNNIYQSLAVGAIMVVIVAVLAALTLLPAVIVLLGDKLDWPRKRHYDSDTAVKQARFDHETIHTGFWGKLTRVVMAHPVIALVLAGGFLVLCALPYLNLNPGLGGASQLPDELQAKQAYNVLDEHFAVGRLAPVEIVIDGPVSDPRVSEGIAKIQTAITSQTDANGGPLFGSFIYPEPSADTAGQPRATYEISDDNEVALITAPLNVAIDDEEGYAAIAWLRDDVVPDIEREMNGASVYVTGVTANNSDFFEMRDTYTPIVFAFVLGMSFLLLLVVFRSIVVAAKAIAMNLLSVGAAYGLLVWVFQSGHLTGFFGFQQIDAIEAWLPLFLFSILFGLSMDYHVFLLSRIREHYDHTSRNAESVAVGLQATARIITGAALIMVAVFGGFASGSLYFMQQMGFGLGIAVLLDATIVRSILVPAAMALLGDRNWYLPNWLHRLPDLRIEGPRVEHLASEPAAAPAD